MAARAGLSTLFPDQPALDCEPRHVCLRRPFGQLGETVGLAMRRESLEPTCDFFGLRLVLGLCGSYALPP